MISPSTYTRGVYGGDMRTAGHIPVFAGKNNEKPAQAGESKLSVNQAVSAAGESKPSGFLEALKTVIDVINPLQHLPVVSTFYRHITGDEINPVARIAGDALFGGPLGAVVGLADVSLEKMTGKDIGATALAFLEKKPAPDNVTLASTEEILWNANIEWNDAPVAHDQVAERMMEALDKYKAMKTTENANHAVEIGVF